MSRSIPSVRHALRLLPSCAASLIVLFGLTTAESLLGGGAMLGHSPIPEAEQVSVGPAVRPEVQTAREDAAPARSETLACALEGGGCVDPDMIASAGNGPPQGGGISPPRVTTADLLRDGPSDAPAEPGLPMPDPIPVVFSVDPQFSIAGDFAGHAGGSPGAGGAGGGSREMPVLAFLPGTSSHSSTGQPAGQGGGGGSGEESGGSPAPAGFTGGGSGGGGGASGGAGGGENSSDETGDSEDEPSQLLRLAAAPDAAPADDASAVPEPASAALFAFAIAALALRRRR